MKTLIKKNGYLSEEKAKSIFCQIVNALDVLHERGIPLGLISPEMIHFDQNGKVVLDIVWNIFKLKKRINIDLIARESFMYAAPELRSDEDISSVSDWWSLGTVLYEMIYGFNPFYHQSIKVVRKLKNGGRIEFSKNRVVSDECKDLILKLMKNNLRLRLGWKGGGAEIKCHPWLKDTKWARNDDQVEIFKPEFNDPLQIDYMDTDDVALYDALESTARY